MAKLELRYINIMGMDKKLVDGFYFRDLLVNLLEYDEFVKEVDKITGSKIASKKTLEKRQEIPERVLTLRAFGCCIFKKIGNQSLNIIIIP